MRWALLLVAGCYAPSPPEGIDCGPGLTCPDLMMCSFGKCVSDIAPCIPVEDGVGQLTIPLLDSPITVDGDLADWPTCFVTVDRGNAGLVRDLEGTAEFVPGRFSIATDSTKLYVIAEIQSITPLGEATFPDVYLNNAISSYFDADGRFETAAYDEDASQIVVDHANRTAAFRSGSGMGPYVPTIDSATRVTASTVTIELAVTPETFGVAAFASTIGFDIGLVGGNGDVMTTELVWFQACTTPACGCSNMDNAPYCDARQFGRATFSR